MPSNDVPMDALPVDGPCMLLFAPSRKGPRYQTQVEILGSASAHDLERLPVLVEIFLQGESRVDERIIPPDDVQRLRSALRLADDAFRLVLVGRDGRVMGDFDAPAKIGAILEHLESADRTRS